MPTTLPSIQPATSSNKQTPKPEPLLGTHPFQFSLSLPPSNPYTPYSNDAIMVKGQTAKNHPRRSKPHSKPKRTPRLSPPCRKKMIRTAHTESPVPIHFQREKAYRSVSHTCGRALFSRELGALFPVRSPVHIAKNRQAGTCFLA